MKRGDWVWCKSEPKKPYNAGLVIRVAKDGSWCDVRWSGRFVPGITEYWSKRMHTEHLTQVSCVGGRSEGRDEVKSKLTYSKCHIYVEGLDIQCPMCGVLVTSGQTHDCVGHAKPAKKEKRK
jgi:hypothetical protein